MALLKTSRMMATDAFDHWVDGLPKRSAAQVRARVERIASSGHFGDCKRLTEVLFELRWKNGIRVYFTLLVKNEENVMILILGGNKNGQKQDIVQANRMAQRYLADSR